MKLLIVRHGIAEEPRVAEREGRSEEERQLTPEGISRMKQEVPGFRVLVPKIDLFLSSPLVRARETLQLVAEQYPKREVVIIRELAPEFLPDEVTLRLAQFIDRDVVAVFGHEPNLSVLAGYLVEGRSQSLVNLEKGGAILLELPDARSAQGKSVNLGPRSATLCWARTPDEIIAAGQTSFNS